MKTLFIILPLACCLICSSLIASTIDRETTPLTQAAITRQPSPSSPIPMQEGALAYNPHSACTACCGGLAACCFSLRDDSYGEIISGGSMGDYLNVMSYNMMHSSLPYRCGWSIRERFEPACYGVPDACNRRHGVWCSIGGCDKVPDEYDYALELKWHYFISPTYSWKRSIQCCAGCGLAADVIAAAGNGASAAIVLPSIFGLPIAVMSLSCLTPRLCPKLDYLCYSNSCVQCSGYAAACLPWAATCFLVGTGIGF